MNVDVQKEVINVVNWRHDAFLLKRGGLNFFNR